MVLVATKFEDKAVESLSVTVDAAHALFEPVRVPGNIVVEEDVAALEIDPLAGSFRCHQDLDCAVPKLLLGVEPGTGFIPRAGPHAAVDGARRGSPKTSASLLGGRGCP